jgi:hypothetical protein
VFPITLIPWDGNRCEIFKTKLVWKIKLTKVKQIVLI